MYACLDGQVTVEERPWRKSREGEILWVLETVLLLDIRPGFRYWLRILRRNAS
jgi:hypothetical protein